MSTLYENNTTPDDGYSSIYNTNVYAQTFTPQVSHTIRSIKIKVKRTGSGQNLTFRIQNTTSGKPNGVDIATGIVSNSSWSNSSWEWQEISLGVGALLAADTMYAIVFATNIGSTNWFSWRKNTGNDYSRGTQCYSGDTGSTWTIVSSSDNSFEESGDPSVVSPTVTTQAVSSIAPTTATGNGNITATGGEDASAWGVCWNTGGSPTTSDSKAAGTGSGGTGAFTASITGLDTETKYYVRAYATNSAGTSYGAEVDFTSLNLAHSFGMIIG